MSAPPIPPRPQSYDGWDQNNRQQNPNAPPPIPPLPPNFRVDESPPHFGDAMVAPRPQKLMKSVPADMAESLENQATSYNDRSSSYGGGPPPMFPMAMPSGGNTLSPYNNPGPYLDPYRQSSPAPPRPVSSSGYYSPPPQSYQQQQQQSIPPPQNWAAPQWIDPIRGPSPAPPPPSQSAQWTTSPPPTFQRPLSAQPPPGGPRPQSFHQYSQSSISQSFADLSFQSPPTPSPVRANTTRPIVDATIPVVFRPVEVPFAPVLPKPGLGQPPNLTVSLPTTESLKAAAQRVASSEDPAQRLAWSKQVLSLVDRNQIREQQLNPRPDTSSTQISDPKLVQLTDQAISQILALCSAVPANPSEPFPSYLAEALYIRGTLSAAGSFPTYVPRDQRAAFKDFEKAARNGYHTAWFKIGRDYESVNELQLAKDCFERGVRANEKNCLYRMGMANLLGQLDRPKDSQAAIPLLKRSADLSDVEAAQSAYVYGMLLLGEFSHVDLPSAHLDPYLPRTPGDPRVEPRLAEARRYIERAAYLNFGPAQYKAGWAYEFAKMGCAFDPLLSVQYYSLASQQGEDEADMALSKWFLCGAEGCFEKEESLAFTFAEKAAKKGLPTAEFAMGYYFEVGVGGKKDLVMAKKWYERAAMHKNPDAPARLEALAQSEALSREQHDAITTNKLVRKRTQAKEMSNAAGRQARTQSIDRRQAQQMAQSAMIPEIPEPRDQSPPARRQDLAAAAPVTVVGAQSQEPRRGMSPGRTPQPQKRMSAGYQQQGNYPAQPQRQTPPLQRPPSQQQQQQQQQQQKLQQSLQQRPQQRIQQQSANNHRYSLSLSDPPMGGTSPAPSAPTGRTNTSVPVSPAAAPAVAAPPANAPPKKNGPATFAEMGFQSAALEEKDCIIM